MTRITRALIALAIACILAFYGCSKPSTPPTAAAAVKVPAGFQAKVDGQTYLDGIYGVEIIGKKVQIIRFKLTKQEIEDDGLAHVGKTLAEDTISDISAVKVHELIGTNDTKGVEVSYVTPAGIFTKSYAEIIKGEFAADPRALNLMLLEIAKDQKPEYLVSPNGNVSTNKKGEPGWIGFSKTRDPKKPALNWTELAAVQRILKEKSQHAAFSSTGSAMAEINVESMGSPAWQRYVEDTLKPLILGPASLEIPIEIPKKK
jgi:hypothetical protein